MAGYVAVEELVVISVLYGTLIQSILPLLYVQCERQAEETKSGELTQYLC